MSALSLPPLDLTPQWGRLNDGLIALVDYVPEDKLDWSPKPGLYNFRGILLHISMARHNWLANTVKDGEQVPDVLAAQSKPAMQAELQRSWDRLRRFLADPEKLAADYEGFRGERAKGHWIAFHLLEHDVHHRADIFHYLALLGIEHPDVGTP